MPSSSDTPNAQAKLLDGPLLSVPSSASRELKGLLADLRNRQEMFFKQVLEHQELLRGQLLALQLSSQVSIDAQSHLKQGQQDLIASFREFSCKSWPVQNPEDPKKAQAHHLDNAESLTVQNGDTTAGPESGAGPARIMDLSTEVASFTHNDDTQHKNPSIVQKASVASRTIGVRRDTVGAKRTSTGNKLFGEMGMDKNQLDQEEYNVAQFYYDTGLAQRIARSEVFGNITLVVIALNAVYIGYDADNNLQENLLDADLQFQILENAFCVFFFFEWAVRFGAFRRKCDGLKDMWFKFDSILVAMMVVETWIFPVALSGGTGIPSGLVKLVRLLRLARMARMMRAFPDLVAMIKGVKVASRAVGSALLMLIGLVYVYAIVLFTLLKDTSNEFISARFRRLGLTMWTLLVDGTFLDGFATLTRKLMDTNNYAEICVLLLFVLCSALTVMNMLIGVLCEVVSAVAAAEKEDSAIRLVKEKLLVMLREIDEDNSGLLSHDEMSAVLSHQDAIDVLSSLQVDVMDLLDMLEMFFEKDGELSILLIMDLILMLRGERTPTMKDVLLGNNFSHWKVNKAFADVKGCIQHMSTDLSYSKIGIS